MHRETEFRSFAEFYAFYLTEHRHPVSRVLHYVGTWGAILCLLTFAITGEGVWGIAALISGYSFACSNAIVVPEPASQFPNCSVTLSATQATLLDVNSDSKTYKYVVHLLRNSDNQPQSLDPASENGK